MLKFTKKPFSSSSIKGRQQSYFYNFHNKSCKKKRAQDRKTKTERKTRRDRAGNTKANGRERRTDLGQVFNFKLGCFDDDLPMWMHAHIYS